MASSVTDRKFTEFIAEVNQHEEDQDHVNGILGSRHTNVRVEHVDEKGLIAFDVTIEDGVIVVTVEFFASPRTENGEPKQTFTLRMSQGSQTVESSGNPEEPDGLVGYVNHVLAQLAMSRLERFQGSVMDALRNPNYNDCETVSVDMFAFDVFIQESILVKNASVAE